MAGSDQFQIQGNAAEFYDQLPARYLLGPWSAGLVDAANLSGSERVLDLACGTGVVTREVASRLGPTGHVTGLDLNAGMLEVAKSYDNGGSGGFTWVQASALETELPKSSFDVVVCQQGFQFFPDQGKALTETHRILKDGGRLCFSIWAESGPYNDAVAEAVAAHIDEETANRFKQSRDVPSPEQLRSMFEAAGFQSISIERVEMRNRLPNIAEFIASHLLGVPIADKVRELSDAARKDLGADAARRLSSYADGGDAVVPDFINLVTAAK
jgi:ubiquinone/menaquinone biosynthesis C-methylase UbiE